MIFPISLGPVPHSFLHFLYISSARGGSKSEHLGYYGLGEFEYHGSRFVQPLFYILTVTPCSNCCVLANQSKNVSRRMFINAGCTGTFEAGGKLVGSGDNTR